MKKLLIALAAVLVSVATYAQGTVQFTTISGAVNAPVNLIPGDIGPGPAWSAALYKIDGGVATLIPGSTTTFRDGSANALLAKYVTPISEVIVPGTTVGGSATLQMRAWLSSAGSYEAASATQRGSSDNLNVTGLGGGVNFPADLPNSFTGFVINTVPEPSTLVLGAMGAAALLLRRRK